MVLIMRDMYKGDQETENVDEMLARERAENFAANPEPNIFITKAEVRFRRKTLKSIFP